MLPCPQLLQFEDLATAQRLEPSIPGSSADAAVLPLAAEESTKQPAAASALSLPDYSPIRLSFAAWRSPRSPATAATRSLRVPFPELEPLSRASRQSSIRKISEADEPPLLIQARILHALLHFGVARQGEQIRSSPLTPVDPILHSNVTL